MIIKIRYKLLFILALTSIASVFAMAFSMHWNTQRNFAIYRDQAESETIDQFVTVLQRYYRRERSWNALIDQDALLDLFLLRERSNAGKRPPKEGFVEKSLQAKPKLKHTRAETGTDRGPKLLKRGPPRGPGGQNKGNTHRPPPPHRDDGRSLPSRLLLLDSASNKISGRASFADTKIKIFSRGELVGWLGIAKNNGSRLSPIELAFLKKERSAFYLALAIVSFMSLIIALVFSKQFERPLRRLAALAKALTEGDFTARSNILRKDELGELALDLNTLANTLERNETMREQWIADTSHELKTPVTILKGEIEALRDKVHQPSDEVLASLQEEADHLAKLIDDLNTLSQADNKSLKFDMQEVPIETLIQDSCANAQALINEHNAKVILSLNANGVNISCDSTRLKQVFCNLLMNGLRYSSSPGILYIKTKTSMLDNNECIEILFEDTPPCPSEEELKHVFDRFYRTEASRNRKTGGRGLGLSICKNIIEAHNGSIVAYAARSGGMGIRIQLPKL